MRFLVFFLCVSALFPFRGNATSDTIYIDGKHSKIDVLRHIKFYRDTTNRASLKEVSNGNLPSFKISTANSLNLGFNSDCHWVKFSITNKTSKLQEYIYAIYFMSINYIDYYDVVNDSVIKEIHTGELRDISSRDLMVKDFAFSIKLKPNDTHTIFIRIFNNGDSVSLPMSLLEEKYFIESTFYDAVFSGILLSLFIFMLIFTVFYNLMMKDSLFSYYMFYLLSISVSCFYLEGVLHFIVPFNKWFIDHSIYLSTVFAGVFLSLFIDNFLQLRKHNPIFKKILLGINICLVFSAVLMVFDYPIFLYGIVLFSILIPSLVVYCMFISGIIAIKFKKKFAYFIFSSLLFGGIGSCIYFLKDFGYLPVNLFTSKVMLLSILLDSTAIFLAIMFRIRSLQVESQSDLEKQNQKIKEQNELLEQANVELQRLSFVISQIDSGVGIYNEKGMLIWINNGFENIHGITFASIKTNNYYISSFYEKPIID